MNSISEKSFVTKLLCLERANGDLIAVKGVAVMNGLCSYTGIPKFLSPTVALSALDISRLVTQLDRYVSRLKKSLISSFYVLLFSSLI
jgi:hypothetical protein